MSNANEIIKIINELVENWTNAACHEYPDTVEGHVAAATVLSCAAEIKAAMNGKNENISIESSFRDNFDKAEADQIWGSYEL